MKRDGRLCRFLDRVGEKSALGEYDELSEFGGWHLEILARDSFKVGRRVHLTLGLSDHTADRILGTEFLEVDGVEYEEWSIGLTCHDEFGFVVRWSGWVGLVWDGVEHDEHFFGTGSEFETVGRHDGVISVIGDVTLTFERHVLDFRAEIMNVSEDGGSASQGMHVGGFVYAGSAESYECVSDVEFSLRA